VAIYLDFYLIAIAAMIFSQIITRFLWKEVTKRILVFLIIGIQILNFMLLYTVFPYKDFGEHHGDNLPLEEKLKDKLTEGRIISIGFDTWASSPQNNHSYLTAPTLGFNYATLWGLDYFAGYEPLLPLANYKACLGLYFIAIIRPDEPIPVDYLRKAAVKWYIVPKEKEGEYSKKFNTYGIIKKYTDENRVVFYDAKAYPMIFGSNGEKIQTEEYRVTTNTIELGIDNQQSKTIIFNNLYNSFFEGYIDGKKVKLTPNDKNIHFSITVPEGKHHITIRYRDPYFIIGTFFAFTFLIAILVVCIIRNKIRKSSTLVAMM